jgi:hypothetical protein
MSIRKLVVVGCLTAGMGMGAIGVHSSFAARAIIDGAVRRSVNTGGVAGNKVPRVGVNKP